MRALPADDLDLVLAHTAGFWGRFRGARLFVTGGTGFVGRWLLEAVMRANDVLDARIEVLALTRDPQRAQAQLGPLLARPGLRLVAGDVAQPLPAVGAFDLCVHAATDVAGSLQPGDPLRVFDSIVGGTRRVLDLARAGGASRFLHTSSGAVYGTQPPDLEALPESHAGAPDPLQPAAAYGNGKRAAEWLTAAYAAEGLPACNARIFALLGPGLPLTGGFAAGNFIRDALAGETIRVAGDGRPLRSYLYMADLCVWLLRILQDGAPGAAYNVGAARAVSIAELAGAVASAAGGDLRVQVRDAPVAGTAAPRYVPDTRRARQELGLAELTPLATALQKTIAWNRLPCP